MSSLHDLDPIRTPDPRPSRCLRHSVWMAVCDDCRDARAGQLARHRAARDSG